MMFVPDPVVRSVSVRGSCAEWLPVVEDSLRSNGFSHVAADLSSQRLTAAYSGGSVSVALSPSADGQEALISVSVVPCFVGGGLPC